MSKERRALRRKAGNLEASSFDPGTRRVIVNPDVVLSLRKSQVNQASPCNQPLPFCTVIFKQLELQQTGKIS